MTGPRVTSVNRQTVLEKTGGHCAYCGIELALKDMQVDHVEARKRWLGDETKHLDIMDNYLPACRSCNYYKSTLTLDDFRDRMDLMITNLERNSTVKALLRYGKIEFTRGPVTFYYEQIGLKLDLPEDIYDPAGKYPGTALAYQNSLACQALKSELVQLRHSKGLDESDIADRLGIPLEEVARVEAESSNPTLLTLHSYASAVGAKIAFTIEPEGDDR